MPDTKLCPRCKEPNSLSTMYCVECYSLFPRNEHSQLKDLCRVCKSIVDTGILYCEECLPPPKPMENILHEADRITSVDRKKEYGEASKNFERTAKLWSVILGMEVTPLQVILCMVQLKVAREVEGHKRDSLVDICGYARCAEMVMDDIHK